MEKVKPVLRFTGSKYRQLENLFNIFDLKGKGTFVDLFGGSGIVGVNVKHNFPNMNVIINDYDNILPIKTSYALKNMLTFAGNGKNHTKAALKYFNKRVENGY
jgi:DNA adenine methylase